MRKPASKSAQELGEEVMDIVAKAAGRRLFQALEQVYEEEIAPRDARIKELEAALAKADGASS
jgi:hypothetical protein